jgi:hypothetical protein
MISLLAHVTRHAHVHTEMSAGSALIAALVVLVIVKLVDWGMSR